MKSCNKCKILKPLSEYAICRANKDGLQYRCKACSRADNLKQYHLDPSQSAKRQKERSKTPHGRAVRLWHAAKKRADDKALAFSLSVDWIEERINAGKCEASGIAFDLLPDGGVRRPWGPSLDRIDQSMGYTEDNTQVVCWLYNQAKGVYSHDAVLTLAEALRNGR